MANQVEPGTVGGAAPDGVAIPEAHGGTVVHPPFHGRKISWMAVSVIVVGFVIGALALVFGHHGPTWWIFWVGAAVAVVGLLITLVTNTFEDWY